MSIDRLAEAQLAMQRGDKIQARKILGQVLLVDRNNEQAWLMMARLADTEKQVVECLEWALKVNPNNRSTQSALVALKRRSGTPAKASTTYAPREYPQSTRAEVRPTQPQVLRVEPTEKQIQLVKENGKAIQAPHRKVNWSLLIGSVIVFLVVVIAIVGPRIAPQDPNEEHAILQVGEKWVIPPFNAFQVKGYILGSDEFGRDLLSRILFAVRPTLIMVIIVAMVRLFLGTLIGLGAGWSTGRIGRILDGLISAALSVPIFMVALAAIAMLGAEIGLLAFISRIIN